MVTDKRIGVYRFHAEAFEMDFTGHLTYALIGNRLLNCAGLHAGERGFGIISLNEHDYTWVLSRLILEFDDRPGINEDYSIRTWVQSVYKLFSDRAFELLDSSGNIIGRAHSTWAMIDVNTRKPADLSHIYGDVMSVYVCDRECPVEKASRIRVSVQEPCSDYVMKYSDIDINGHVNSIRYIEHILDLFPCSMYSSMYLRRMEISYVSESYEGDRLVFFMQSPSDGVYDVELRKADSGSETVCRARLVFGKL